MTFSHLFLSLAFLHLSFSTIIIFRPPPNQPAVTPVPPTQGPKPSTPSNSSTTQACKPAANKTTTAQPCTTPLPDKSTTPGLIPPHPPQNPGGHPFHRPVFPAFPSFHQPKPTNIKVEFIPLGALLFGGKK